MLSCFSAINLRILTKPPTRPSQQCFLSYIIFHSSCTFFTLSPHHLFLFFTHLSSHTIIAQIPSQLPSSLLSRSLIIYPPSSTPSWLSAFSTSLTAPLSPHPIPEASQYQGQCNPAICNLQLKPFNLSRLNTKKMSEQELKKFVPIAQQASWLLWEQSGGVRMRENR